MTQEVVEIVDEPEEGDEAAEIRRRWPKVVGLVGGVVAVGMVAVWLTREKIADDVISSQLAASGLPGTYKVEEVGVSRQVITNLVIGDPKHPDLTVDRVEIAIEPRFGFPAIGGIRLLNPHLFGAIKDGRLSFGALDKWIFAKGAKPAGLPDMDLVIDGGTLRLDSDYGPVGMVVSGKGGLKNGFAGELAAIAPKLALPGCKAERLSLYGKLSTSGGQPAFAGPLRLAKLDCGQRGLRTPGAAMQVTAKGDASLDGGEAKLVLESGASSLGSAKASALGGTALVAWRKGLLTTHYDLALTAPSSPAAAAANLALKGSLRAQSAERIEGEGTLTGAGLRLGKASDGALRSAQASLKDTLLAPLVAQMRSALEHHSRASRLNAEFVVRRNGAVTNVVIPRGAVTGQDGGSLLAVSRLQVAADGGRAANISGAFTTGGAGLPRLSGRIEQAGHGSIVAKLAMADYRAGGARLALPQLAVAVSPKGAIGFSGKAVASGAIPGGSATGLELPLDGRWEPGRAFEAWRGCRDVHFAGLTYGNLTLDRQALRLCPAAGAAIVHADGRGTRFAVRTDALDLAGRLKDTPIRLASGPLALASDGRLTASSLAVTLGKDPDPTRLAFDRIEAVPGKDLSGTFAGGTGSIHNVPLVIREAAAGWRYAGGRLDLTGASFRLLDQQKEYRFNPLMAQDATLSLADNRIAVEARLREPKSGRLVSEVTIAHDLGTGAGNARLSVPGITFDHDLQPDTLTPFALGVVANARGIVTGEGRIDWTADNVTSSGRFSTEGVDFAAPFGPTKGVAGTVVFTDLIGLVTAPDQQLKIASINPGIEATDGELSFELRKQGELIINGARWPFLDGSMRLLPTRMKLGTAEVRRYELRMNGISAERFVEKMDLGNLSATGLFDGNLPLVFDQNGGRIEGGSLVSRAPGGNVAYVGELTYKDLSAMANFAFETLRSLDYRKMSINLDGDLGGEIVTRVRFDGVRQGHGAKRNFVTRQLAHLPIQMNVNVRAPFFQLVSRFKAFSDPTYLPDPQRIGLIEGGGVPNGAAPSDSQQDIQPSASEKKP